MKSKKLSEKDQEKIRSKILKAIREGRVDIKPIPKFTDIKSIDINGYIFHGIDIDFTWNRKDSLGFVIRWACKGKVNGFGECQFFKKLGKLQCNSEGLSKEFCNALLTAFLICCEGKFENLTIN